MEKIQNNLFLKQFYKERQKYKIDDKYNSSPILINWILKKEDTE